MWVLTFSTHWTTHQENPHFTDGDTEAEMGDLTCPGSLGQHRVELRLELKSLSNSKALFVCRTPPALRTPTSHLYSSLGLRGTAIVPGFWNVLLASTGVHLVWASHNMPLPAFLCGSETMSVISSILPFLSEGRGRPLANYFKARLWKENISGHASA